jgi:CTP:molybdopterin cytidylyltransferase MocA
VTAGLLLAAGGGSRLGRPKALVELGGQLLVERGVAVLTAAGCDPVVVVLGAAAAEVRARARLAGALVVDNPDWRTGMGSSLRVGLAALARAEAADVVVALVDQPGVSAALIRRLVAAPGPAAVATYAGQPRTPVRLARAVWPEVAAGAAGDVGARRWLRAHPDRVTLVGCDDLGSPDDIDTPADLAGRTQEA